MPRDEDGKEERKATVFLGNEVRMRLAVNLECLTSVSEDGLPVMSKLDLTYEFKNCQTNRETGKK